MPQARTLSFVVPCGKGGLNRMDNYLDFPVEDLAWMDGIAVERNAWEKEPGAVKFNSVGLFDQTVLSNSSQDWTVAVAGNIVTVDTITAHGFLAGWGFATDSNWSVNAFMNGLSGKTLIDAPSANTFRFALTQADQGATTETSATAGMTGTTTTAANLLEVKDFWYDDTQGTAERRLYVLTNTNHIAWFTTAGAVGGDQEYGGQSHSFGEWGSVPRLVEAYITQGATPTTYRSLALFDASLHPAFLVITGTADSFTSFATIPDEWTTGRYPHFGFPHNFRLLCFTKVDSNLYMSNPLNHSQFKNTSPNTRVMPVFPAEQHYIASGISWRGRAYLFKWERGIYYVEDSDPNLANWTIQKVTDAVGVAGPGSVVAYEDDVIFLGSDGYFYSLSDVQTLGQRSVKPILPAELGEFIRAEINLNRLDLVESTYYARKRQLWFALPATGSSVNNRRLIFDANLPGKIRITWSERDTMVRVATRRATQTQSPIWSDQTGFVWAGDQTARHKATAAYTGQFETPPLTLYPADDRFGNLRELHTTFKPQGDYDLSLEVHTDDTLKQTLTLSQQSSGSPTGSFSLDADVLAGTQIATTVTPLEGEARRVKLIGKNAVASENFAVQQFTIRHTPGRHGAV